MRHIVPIMLLVASTPLFAQEKSREQQIDRIRQVVLSRGENPAAIAQLVQLARDLPAEAAAGLYAELAEEYLRQGQYDQAGELLRQLVEQYPEQPTRIPSLITLLQLYTSSEVAHCHANKPRANFAGEDLATYALHLGTRPAHQQLLADPALAFQCAVAARRSGRLSAAQNFLTPLKHNPRVQPWHQRAQAESWLTTQRELAAPLPVSTCLPIPVRPILDGQLEDLAWQAATAAARAQGVVSFYARDDKFLYWAARVPLQPDVSYAEEAHPPRHHDTALAAHDHVQLQLDVDRDYATSFCLAVDYRGQTADRCWKTARWNPSWFVAATQQNTSWSLEVAIPWTALGDTAPLPGDAWVVAIQRFLPDRATASPELELLLFQ